jgi:hypothetical protein
MEMHLKLLSNTGLLFKAGQGDRLYISHSPEERLKSLDALLCADFIKV